MRKFEKWLYLQVIKLEMYLSQRMVIHECKAIHSALLKAIKKYDKHQVINTTDLNPYPDALMDLVEPEEIDGIVRDYFKDNKGNSEGFDMYIWEVIDGRQKSNQLDEPVEMLN